MRASETDKSSIDEIILVFINMLSGKKINISENQREFLEKFITLDPDNNPIIIFDLIARVADQDGFDNEIMKIMRENTDSNHTQTTNLKEAMRSSLKEMGFPESFIDKAYPESGKYNEILQDWLIEAYNFFRIKKENAPSFVAAIEEYTLKNEWSIRWPSQLVDEQVDRLFSLERNQILNLLTGCVENKKQDNFLNFFDDYCRENSIDGLTLNSNQRTIIRYIQNNNMPSVLNDAIKRFRGSWISDQEKGNFDAFFDRYFRNEIRTHIVKTLNEMKIYLSEDEVNFLSGFPLLRLLNFLSLFVSSKIQPNEKSSLAVMWHTSFYDTIERTFPQWVPHDSNNRDECILKSLDNSSECFFGSKLFKHFDEAKKEALNRGKSSNDIVSEWVENQNKALLTVIEKISSHREKTSLNYSEVADLWSFGPDDLSELEQNIEFWLQPNESVFLEKFELYTSIKQKLTSQPQSSCISSRIQCFSTAQIRELRNHTSTVTEIDPGALLILLDTLKTDTQSVNLYSQGCVRFSFSNRGAQGNHFPSQYFTGHPQY